MAYAIITNNELYRIASNETEKNDLNINESDYIIKDISDADFLKLKNNVASTTFANDTLTITDKPADTILGTAEEIQAESKRLLQEHHQNLINQFNAFLKGESNASKSLHSIIESYKNYLSNFDYDSLTYPLNKTWEEYCSENSISYINALQIP